LRTPETPLVSPANTWGSIRKCSESVEDGFEHAEDRAAQETSLRLFTQLARDGLPEALEWAQKHYYVIARFGRYPHHNAILGRESTPEEIEFLQQPGSRF
jgi:uncharacterized protein (DUF924 family)